MADISGFLPSILYNEIPHENYENLYSKGSDIDITISNGSSTYISGITLGNGSWEIDELDDNLNLFPEYSAGDVISRDVLLKVLMSVSSLNQSRHIFSFNALGKVKYGIKDVTDKVTKAKQWLTDEITPEIAQDFLQKSYPGARIGKIDKYSSKDGGIYKVMFGVPSEKKYYVMCLQRNGNKIRELDDDDYKNTPIYSFTDGNLALKGYNQYPKEIEGSDDEQTSEITEDMIKEIVEKKDGEELIDWEQTEEGAVAVSADSNTEEGEIGIYVWKIVVGENGTLETDDFASFEIGEQDNVKEIVNKVLTKYEEFGGEKDLSYFYEESIKNETLSSGEDDGVRWEVKQSLKKKKGKSEFWGKNVTGYEDGSLGEMTISNANLFSKFLRCNLKSTKGETMSEILVRYRNLLERKNSQ